jgi:hypothetical protein
MTFRRFTSQQRDIDWHFEGISPRAKTPACGLPAVALPLFGPLRCGQLGTQQMLAPVMANDRSQENFASAFQRGFLAGHSRDRILCSNVASEYLELSAPRVV